MKESLKLSMALGIICALAAAILTFANEKTRKPRQEAERRSRQQALRLVLPDFDNDPLQDVIDINTPAGKVRFYQAKQGNTLMGLAGEGASPKGYGGNIQVLIGLNPNGEIGKLLVTNHKETPGLGTQVTDRKQVRSIWSIFKKDAAQTEEPGLPPCEYLDQYSGKVAQTGNFKITQDGGDIEAISGATVSSRAVADAVITITQAFNQNKSDITSAN